MEAPYGWPGSLVSTFEDKSNQWTAHPLTEQGRYDMQTGSTEEPAFFLKVPETRGKGREGLGACAGVTVGDSLLGVERADLQAAGITGGLMGKVGSEPSLPGGGSERHKEASGGLQAALEGRTRGDRKV